MPRLIKLVSLLFCLFILGCSQRFQDTNATLKEAFIGFDDLELTADEVAELPYASMYARINNGQQIFMVLAYAETNPKNGNTQLKWLSSDKAMIVTENGRIVKTLRLPGGDLVAINELNEAPTKEAKQYSVSYDWQPNYQYGQPATVKSKSLASETITSLLWQKNTSRIEEFITFTNTQQSMTNLYWLDDKNKVVKSAQWLIPDQLLVELEFLKFYGEQ